MLATLPPIVLPLVLIAAAGVLLLLRERLRGLGPVVQESRPMPPFHTIDCKGFLDVTVVCRQDPHVAVATTPAMLDRVRTSVKDGVLHVRTRVWWRPSQQVALDVTVPTLTEMTVGGASRVTIANAPADSVALHLDRASTVAFVDSLPAAPSS